MIGSDHQLNRPVAHVELGVAHDLGGIGDQPVANTVGLGGQVEKGSLVQRGQTIHVGHRSGKVPHGPGGRRVQGSGGLDNLHLRHRTSVAVQWGERPASHKLAGDGAPECQSAKSGGPGVDQACTGQRGVKR
jgi:hypothetical protein